MKNMIFVVSEVGYTWEEVIVPYMEYKKYGYNVDFSTITGGKPKVDPLSILVRPFMNKVGFGISRSLSMDSEIGKELIDKLDKSISIDAINPNNYEGIFLAGGHGSLFDMNKNKKLHMIIMNFYKKDKKVVAICHAASTLAFVNNNGKSLIEDKKVTGFPTFEEKFILRFNMIHSEFLPMPIWTGKELNKYSKKRNLGMRIWEVINQNYAIKDGNIITGVGPKAGKSIVKKAVGA
jgi:putative intracellular protease/amidase